MKPTTLILCLLLISSCTTFGTETQNTIDWINEHSNHGIITTKKNAESTTGIGNKVYMYQFLCAKGHIYVNMQYQFLNLPDSIKTQ